MITIDKKKQIFSCSFLASNDQQVEIIIPIEEASLPIGMVFCEAKNGEERNAAWESKSGVVQFTFTGWSNSLGTCVAEPMKFADFGNQKIYFQLAHSYIGTVNLVHLFIYLGGENE